ncbi:MAG: sigma-70 family RNA polymerase sigma factor [Fibrobacteraceae bacterium]|nr:sigma-70 family RNA polymerase sigma factor [Fibrobacteraceae bacterium]
MNSNTETLNWIKDKFKDERPLTTEEETEIFKLIRQGNTLAKAKMLNANMKFVIQVAKEYNNETLTTEELINEGAIGLWRSIESFDYTRGVRFITYAVWWIKAFIARAISEKGSLIRLPLNQQTKIHKEIKKAREKSSYHNETYDVNDEVKELNIIGGRHVSIEASLNADDDLHLEDILADDDSLKEVDQAVEYKMLQNFTTKLLNKLPDREREIVSNVYGCGGKSPKGMREQAISMKLSKERVRQLRDQGLARLRNLNYDKHLNPIIKELLAAQA